MRVKYVVAAACAVLILAPLAVVHFVLRASLPSLDGDIHHLGVVSPVTIDRDALGVPTIEATNRVDLAYGIGFAHGQDRFFEMDLSRRLPAGELSEVFGKVAVEQDKKARLFRFRQLARVQLQQGTPEQRAVLEAYARGVNAGLASLRSRPWEYWVLGSVPVEWRPEDTFLVSDAMWWDLQYFGIEMEIQRLLVNERVRGPDCENGWKCGMQFLYPATAAWDAPNSPTGVVTVSAASQVPSPEVLDVRRGATQPVANRSEGGALGTGSGAWLPWGTGAADRGIGSNNWAVSGRLTTTGAALIANDMHLRARVPIIWYRARMRIKGSLDLNGVTLPGTPLLVAGSNGHIAWGFTNSYGSWIDVKKDACTATTAEQHEQIRVHGAPEVDFAVKSGPAGVLYRQEGDTCWFASWLAQQPAATNINLMSLEHTTSVAQALELAPTLGIPHQNFVVGDDNGHIAWTIGGRIPTGSGPGRATGTPVWTTPESHPRIVDPEIGRIWTANSRPTNDQDQLAAIGGGDAFVGADYNNGARARQIRDDLLALKGPAAPADMLRIQLDDHAVFLDHWHTFIVELLDTEALANHPERAEFKRLVETWNARASTDSVGYRLVRDFHERLEQSVWDMMLSGMGITPIEQTEAPTQFEEGLWVLVHQRPLHLLAREYADWPQFLLGQVDATIADLHKTCPQLAGCTWGAHRPVHIQHPLSKAIPLLSRFLDMPEMQLPGDHYMPRVQDGSVGASERFAVSPGHEDQGYIHLPGGQSGHPLSPYYRAGFTDWAVGRPIPFLPGPSEHRLTLQAE